MLHGSLFGSMIRAGIYRQANRVCGSSAGRQFHAFSQIPRSSGVFSGVVKSPKNETSLQLSIFRNPGMKLGLVGVVENVSLPCALTFRSFVHSGEHTEVGAGKNEHDNTQGSGNGVNRQPPHEVEVGMNLGSMALDQLLPGAKRTRVNTRPPLENEAAPMSMNYDQPLNRERGPRVNTRPPLENEAAPMSMNYDQPLNRERGPRVNTRPPLENNAGSTPMSMEYVKGLLRVSSVNGEPLNQSEVQTGMLPRPMDNVGRFQSRDNGLKGDLGFYNQPQYEANADIVHIKLMRNNSHVTLTDHLGARKLSVSAGQVAAKGDKPGRYSGEAAAEHMGRVVKQMKIRSVVVKVSGFTFFRRKKDAILAFKDGYTHSRGDMNPIVYIEDTTRKPHNGCRLPKKRRI